MITSKPTVQMIEQWKKIHREYTGAPNRKTGEEIIAYLQGKYVLTETADEDILETATFNITENEVYAMKLPCNAKPAPRAFYIENEGAGEFLYAHSNSDGDIWDEWNERILVSVDPITGWYSVVGSTLLWDEICAFAGLDVHDLENYVCTAEYVLACERIGKIIDKTLLQGLRKSPNI